MGTISRWSFALFKWLILIIVLSWFITRLDLLWPRTIDRIHQQIADDPNLESRLEQYAILSETTHQILEPVAPSGSIHDAIKYAKETIQVWGDLTSLVDKAAPGAGLTLKTLDFVIEKITKLNRSLNDIQELNTVADASRNFRFNPKQAELQTFAELSGGKGAQGLLDIEPIIGDLAEGVRSLNREIDELLKGLKGTQTQNSNTTVGKAASRLYITLQSIRQPLFQLEENVYRLRSDIHNDVKTLQSIYWRVTIVSAIDDMLETIPLVSQIRNTARTVLKHLDFAFYLAITLLLLGFGFRVGDWYDRRKGERSTHQVNVTIPPTIISASNLSTTEVTQPQSQTPVKSRETAVPKMQDISQPIHTNKLSGLLLQRTGQEGEQTIVLPPQGKITLGSARGNDVRLSGSQISRYHAVISAEQTFYTIENLQNTAGTFVNGTKILESYNLQHGDKIMIGNVEFIFVSGSTL